jgi:hypothetical protein
MKIRFKLTNGRGGSRVDFFDSAEVLRALGKAKRDVLAEYGSRVRTTARQSMKQVKKRRPSATPGTPPHAIKGFIKRGKYGVSFRYDKETESVVVGPEPFMIKSSTQVVEAHEHGGTLRVGRGGRIRARYPARPFMSPANEKRLPELAGLWKDSIVR